MPINPVQIPPKNKRDVLDRVLQGVQLANGILGIPVGISQLATQAKERDAIEQKLPPELAKAKSEASIAQGQAAGGILPERALSAGLVPSPSGNILLPLIGPNGSVVMTPHSQKVDPSQAKPTAEQSKAATFAKRMEQANEIFSKLEEGGFDRTSFLSGAQSLLPSAVQSGESQQYRQAEMNFVNAVLRRESGAAISPKEFASAEKQYFPRAGDSPEVVEQKRQNRNLSLEGIRAEAGDVAYGKIPSVGDVPIPKKKGGLIDDANAAVNPPKTGDIVEGYQYVSGDPGKKSNWKKVK